VILEEIQAPDTSKIASASSSVSQPEVSPVVINRRMGENGNEFLVRTGDMEEWKAAENTPSDLVRAFNSRVRTQCLRARRIAKTPLRGKGHSRNVKRLFKM
jgi:hypothetical protein